MYDFIKLNEFLFITDKTLNSLSSVAERKAQMYYKSCLDENKTIEALGAQPLLDILKVDNVCSVLPSYIEVQWF